jgi:hypothetical protein
VVLWVFSDFGSILLNENENHHFDLPFEALVGGEDWSASVERIQKQFLGRSFPFLLWGLSHSPSGPAREAWAFVVFKAQLSEPVQILKGTWKTSLKGLKLGPVTSQVGEMIDTPNATH